MITRAEQNSLKKSQLFKLRQADIEGQSVNVQEILNLKFSFTIKINLFKDTEIIFHSYFQKIK